MAGLSGVRQVSASETHSLAVLFDGTVWAWGAGADGELGTGAQASSSLVPVRVPGLTGIVQVAAGARFSVALGSDGRVWAWGAGSVTQVAAGWRHSLALRSDGTVWGTGFNDHGQLGDGSEERILTSPVQVVGLTGVTQIAAGSFHSAAVRSNRSLWTWGLNSAAQLGDGTTADRFTPVQVTGVGGFVSQVCLGRDLTLAVISRLAPILT